MTKEAAQQEESGGEEQVVVETPETPAATPETGPTEDDITEHARATGHMDYDKWCEAGNAPGEWVTAKEFVAREPIYKRLRQGKAAHKAELDALAAEYKRSNANVAKLAQAQLKQQLKELEKQYTNAVDSADSVEANRLREEIGELEKPEPVEVAPTQAQPSQALNDFIEESPWLEDPKDERGPFALKRLRFFIEQKGLDHQSAVDKVKGEIRQTFGTGKKGNPNRSKANTSESPGGASTRPAPAKTVAWNELTAVEMACWTGSNGAYGTQAEFLKTVAELREGQE